MRIPKAFYDGARALGFWIIRDIYFDQDFRNPNFVEDGHHAIDAVIAEVNDANALDLIFAWEIGNEFQHNETPGWDAGVIEQFIEDMETVALLQSSLLSCFSAFTASAPM